MGKQTEDQVNEKIANYLTKKYFLLPKATVYTILSVVGFATIGGAYAAAKQAINNSVSAQTTSEIEKLKDKATTDVKAIADLRASLDFQKLEAEFGKKYEDLQKANAEQSAEISGLKRELANKVQIGEDLRIVAWALPINGQ